MRCRARGDYDIIVVMTDEEIIRSKDMRSVVADYRAMCFWNMAEDFYPQNREQVLMALDCLEKYGNLDAYLRAGRIRKWL